MVFRFKIILLLLMISFAGFSQTERQPDIAKFHMHIISLPLAEKKYTPLLAVSTIEVYDARFDTANIGLIQRPADSREKFIRVKLGTTGGIKAYFQSLIVRDSLSNTNSVALICFVKKLCLSDKIYVDNNNKVSSKDPVYEVRSGAMATFEFYVKKDEDYLPLYRFDTTVSGEKSVFYNGENYLTEILAASLRKLEILHPEQVRSYNKPKRLFEIDSFNCARLKIPILNQNPKKGIYVNFENFRNNTPVDSPFTVDKSTKGDFLYVRNKKGEEVLQTEIWGYSDGKDSYIYSAENYFKLTRYNNTFLIYGAKDFSNIRKLRLNFSLLDVAIPNSNYSKPRTVSSYKIIPNFFQLDMESGELY